MREIFYNVVLIPQTILEKLQKINGSNHTWFAGSYMGNGFHEDAVRSSVEIAGKMGMEW